MRSLLWPPNPLAQTHPWRPLRLRNPLLGPPPPLGRSQVACGSDFTLALAQDGSLFSFGDNSLCQLGRPSPPGGEAVAPTTAAGWLVNPEASCGQGMRFNRVGGWGGVACGGQAGGWADRVYVWVGGVGGRSCMWVGL